MKFDIAAGKVAESYPNQDLALAASTIAPVIRSLVHDGVTVSPCYLRVIEGRDEHYFPAFFIETFDVAGAKTGEGLMLAVSDGDGIRTDTVWIPPKLLDGEQFSIAHFSRGELQAV